MLLALLLSWEEWKACRDHVMWEAGAFEVSWATPHSELGVGVQPRILGDENHPQADGVNIGQMCFVNLTHARRGGCGRGVLRECGRGGEGLPSSGRVPATQLARVTQSRGYLN